MAASSKPASQTPLKHTTKCQTMTKATEKGNLPDRNCIDNTKHLPHGWYSHILNKEAWCDGSGVLPPYTTSYAAKKDYSKDWREDYDAPMTVKEAAKIAYDMHSKQKDKSGEPYHKHLSAVRLGVVVLGGDHEEQIAALFHDAVEDYHTTFTHLREIGVSENSVKIIEAVSKKSGEEQGKYLARIIEAGAGAMRVKLADLMHNTRHDRIAEVRKSKGDYTADRLLKKYRPAMARLMLELGLIVDEDEQKKLATKPQGTAGSSSWSGSKSSSGSSYTSKTINVEVDNVFPGDWITSTPAPVVETLRVEESDPKTNFKGRVIYLLANGQEWEEDLRWTSGGQSKRSRSVYPQSSWESSNSITFSGVSEDDIMDYIDVLDAAKKARQAKHEGLLEEVEDTLMKQSDDAFLDDYAGWWSQQ